MLLFDFQIFLSSHLIFFLRNIVQIQPCSQSMAWVYGIFNAIFRAGFPKLMLFTLTKTRKINARAHNGQTTDNKAEYPHWGEKTVNKKIDFSFRLATTTTNCKVMSSHWLFFSPSFLMASPDSQINDGKRCHRSTETGGYQVRKNVDINMIMLTYELKKF